MMTSKEESEERDRNVCYFCGRELNKRDLDEGLCSWCGMHFKREDKRIN